MKINLEIIHFTEGAFYIYMCVYVCVCAYTYIYIYIYVYIWIHRRIPSNGF